MSHKILVLKKLHVCMLSEKDSTNVPFLLFKDKVCLQHYLKRDLSLIITHENGS